MDRRKIKNVEEEDRGKVQLADGQEFENGGIQNYVFTERSVMKAETVPVHPTTAVFGVLLSSNLSPLQNDDNALHCAMKSSKSFLDLVKYSLAFLLVLLLLAGALMRSHYDRLPELQCLYPNHTFTWYLEPNITAHLLSLCNHQHEPDAPSFLLTFLTFLDMFHFLVASTVYCLIDVHYICCAVFVNNDSALYDENLKTQSELKRPWLITDGVKVSTVIADKTGTLTTGEKQTMGVVIDVNTSADLPPKYEYLSVDELDANIQGHGLAGSRLLFMHCLTMCNTVEVANNKYEYAYSDEIAYVNMCAMLGCKLTETSELVKTVTFGEKEERFEILREEVFTSETKVPMRVHVCLHIYATIKLCAENGTVLPKRIFRIKETSKASRSRVLCCQGV